jgi:hypothetical protein
MRGGSRLGWLFDVLFLGALDLFGLAVLRDAKEEPVWVQQAVYFGCFALIISAGAGSVALFIWLYR